MKKVFLDFCYRTPLFLQEKLLLLSPEEKGKTSKIWMGLGTDAMLSIPSILAFEIFFFPITKYRKKGANT